jgi:hypothetical protein
VGVEKNDLLKPVARQRLAHVKQTASGVEARRLTVPANDVFISEKPNVIPGATSVPPNRRANRPAIACPRWVSVLSARWGPCCSMAATITMTRMVPAAIASRTSVQVMSSLKTVPVMVETSSTRRARSTG